MDLKKDGSHFTNEQGNLDVNKLLNASPKVLSKFINKHTSEGEGSSEAEGGTGGFSNMATAALNVLAAIAQADGRPHYAPANAQSKEVINTLAASAERSLDLSSGLGMTPGRSSFPDHQSGGINPDYAKKRNRVLKYFYPRLV
jgi:hypothetical protein